MVGPPAPSSLCQGQRFDHKSYHTLKNFFRDFSSETYPRIHHDESLSCSSAPIKATGQAIEIARTVMINLNFEERCTAKNNFETNKFTFSISLYNTVVCVEQSVSFSATVACRGQYLSARTCQEVRIFFEIFLFFFSCQRLKSMRAPDEKHK